MSKQHLPPPPMRQPLRPALGFTLVELIVVLAILAILAVLALPAYRQYVTKGRRTDAYSALAAVQQAQERWRSNHPSYTESFVDLQLPSSVKHYDISIRNATARGYTLTATPSAGGLQTVDSDCASLSIVMKGGTIDYKALSAAAADTSAKCWPQ